MSVFHQHEGNHKHEAPAFNTAFLVSIVANGLFVICQIIFAYIANSTSLLADAVHNLGDVLSLILAWAANSLMKRNPTIRSTYGMKKTSILAALANGVLLVFTCGIIVTEAAYKFFSPSEIAAVPVMIVAAIGIVVNGTTAALFLRGSDDLNIRSAFLHLLYDALISFGVVVSAAVVYYTKWWWVDPMMGLVIATIILKGTWSLFTDSFRLIIDGVPRGISITKVQELLSKQPGVKGVHDLHIWALSTQENAISVHLWMPDAPMSDTARHELSEILHDEHNIHHMTIQVERIEGHCHDACVPYI